MVRLEVVNLTEGLLPNLMEGRTPVRPAGIRVDDHAYRPVERLVQAQSVSQLEVLGLAQGPVRKPLRRSCRSFRILPGG